jgi:hypothetical protein
MKAPAFRSKRASRRAERGAKPLSAPPRPSSTALDPIDEQIASLLECLSSNHQPQPAAVDPDVRPARVSSANRPRRTALAKVRRPRRRARTTRRPHMGAALRPARVSETVRDALSGIAVELPRPYLFDTRPYLFDTVKMAFSLLAIVLCSIAVGWLIVYFMSA